jgi:uncharacterized protein (TIGR02285 family)
MQKWKKMKSSISFLVLVTIVFCYPSILLAKDTITWLSIDFPPLRITKGEQKGDGIGDKAVDFLQERLPEYHHNSIEVNLKRLFYTLKKDKKACTIGIIKTAKREDYLYFSIPALIRPGLSIVIRKENMKTFGNPKKISLAELIKNRDLKLSIDSKRSYTKPIDTILDRHKAQNNVLIRDGYDLTVGFLKMLSKGHIDYVIEYPSQVIYISRELDLGDRFHTIGLEEAPSYTVSHVVCPKSEWGKRVIQKVNVILEQGRPTHHYRSFIERWVDEGRIKEFREVYKEFLNLKE